MLPSIGANVYDILKRDTLVITKAGVEALEARSEMSAQAKHYDVIRKPVITEKATMASEHNAVVFEVAIDANKPQIKEAIEALFGVKVKAVNTTITKGKQKRFRGQLGPPERRQKGLCHPRRGQHDRRDHGSVSRLGG